MSRKKLIFLLVLIVVLVLAGLGGWKWWKMRKIQIQFGLASSKFPYRLYSPEELDRMYPQIKNADVPTRTTPEETYAKFREALRTNNLEMAIEQLSMESEKYEENKNDLEFAYREGRFNKIHNDYNENIVKEAVAESFAQYYFNYSENNQQRSHFISFLKNSDGDWKIDGL